MRVLFLPFVVIVTSVSLAAVAEDGAEPGGEAPKSTEAEPKFSKDSAKADFSNAKVLFEAGKYKEADAVFNRARQQAKGKPDKDLVDRWVQSCAGAVFLQKLKLQKLPKLQLYDSAEEQYLKYRGLPVAPMFQEYLTELEPQVFDAIESFDTPSAKYIEKFGKTFVSDAALVLDGTSCLRWTNTKDRKAATLKLEGMSSDWSGYDAVQFWIYPKVPLPGPEAVIMCGEKAPATPKAKVAPKPKNQAKKPEKRNFWQAALRIDAPVGKWTRIRIPLSTFKQGGSPTWQDILYFQIQIGAGASFDVLLDRFALIRKPSPEATPEATKAKVTPKKTR